MFCIIHKARFDREYQIAAGKEQLLSVSVIEYGCFGKRAKAIYYVNAKGDLTTEPAWLNDYEMTTARMELGRKLIRGYILLWLDKMRFNILRISKNDTE